MSEQDQKNALPNDPWTQENLATEASDESCTTMDDCSRPFASDAPSLNMAAGPDNSPSLQCDQYPICKIKIGERHRRDLGDIDELAASIANVGLLHPVVITPDGTLIAGQRRLAACKKLGWLTVPVHIVDIGEIARGEFAENAYRKRFLPTEVHAIWRALEPIERAAAQERQRVTRFGNGGGKLPPPIKGKTRDKVAKLAGVSGRTMDKIAEVMEAANANARYEPLVRMMDQTESVHGAYNELKAMRAAEAEAAANDGVRRPKAPIQLSAAAYNAAFPQYPPLSEYNGVVYGVWLCGSSWHGGRLHGQYPSNFLPRERRRQILANARVEPLLTIAKRLQMEAERQAIQDAATAAMPPLIGDRYRLVCADMATTDAIAQESVDAIATDPSYPRKYLTCIEHLARRALEWLKPGGSLLVMSGQSYLPEILAALQKSELTYRWTFCCLTNTTGENTRIFDRHIFPNWKPVLWYTKGKCAHLSWTSDIIKADASDKRFHPWGQSVRQMERLVELASLPGQIILDPFCGGGSTGVAALRLGRQFIGVDIDEKSIAQTAARLRDIQCAPSRNIMIFSATQHEKPERKLIRNCDLDRTCR